MHNRHNHLTLICLLAASVAANATDVNDLKAGELSKAGLEQTETSLKITGDMNAADFFYIFDNLNALQSLDLSGANIVAYQGEVLKYTGLNNSPANTLPAYSLTGLTSLKSIVLPKSLQAIGKGSLSGSGITSLSVPDGVNTIGDYALMRCLSLKGVYIPESVTEIGTRAFAYCPELTDVVITASIATIPEGLFEACGGLKELNFEALAQCDEIGPWALADCNGITTLILPAGTELMEKASLYGASGIATLELPDNLSYIGDNAMTGMTSLATLNASTVTSVPELGENVWSRVDSPKVTLVTPDNEVDDYKNADQWKEFRVIAVNDWKSSTINIDISVGSDDITASARDGILSVKSSEKPLGKVAVFNVSGKKVASSDGASNSIGFNIEGWPHGVYLVTTQKGAVKIVL